jgi:4,5-dihydroxyphthalate decarboxylase
VSIKITLAVRDWDYYMPLALGELKPEGFELELVRVGTLPNDLATHPTFDAGEISFSRYTQSIAAGDRSLVCVPHFLMRGFRQRCVITAKNSNLTRFEDLRGKKIGVTGWQDSGNTWTRTLLRRVGVGIDDVQWYAGRLTEAHPIVDRLGRYARPGRIEAVPGERPMDALLAEGELDAVFTPFMPPHFFDKASPLRFLLPDFRSTELRYFNDVGYIPGMHVLGFKPSVLQAHPWIASALSALLDESARIWLERRMKYADTTPWLLDDIRRTAADLPADWNANGLEPNRRMIDDFVTEMCDQQLIDRRVSAEDLFPHKM